MLKRTALKISVSCCALLVATAATAAPREHRADDGRRAASSVSRSNVSVNPFSLQRLLSERFRLSLDIFRSLRALDVPAQTEAGMGKLTIVDEPDPFAIGKDDMAEPGEDSDDTEERHRRQEEQEGANPNTQPYQTMN